MATNTAPLTPPATHLPLPVVKTIGAWVTYSSPGTTVAKRLGTLPAGAIVVGGGAMVTTAFNDSGNDYIDIGTLDDDDAFATDLDVSAVGYKVLDELATHNDYSTSEVGVIATYAGQNSNASAGVAYCFVQFIEPTPASA